MISYNLASLSATKINQVQTRPLLPRYTAYEDRAFFSVSSGRAEWFEKLTASLNVIQNIYIFIQDLVQEPGKKTDKEKNNVTCSVPYIKNGVVGRCSCVLNEKNLETAYKNMFVLSYVFNEFKALLNIVNVQNTEW